MLSLCSVLLQKKAEGLTHGGSDPPREKSRDVNAGEGNHGLSTLAH